MCAVGKGVGGLVEGAVVGAFWVVRCADGFVREQWVQRQPVAHDEVQVAERIWRNSSAFRLYKNARMRWQSVALTRLVAGEVGAVKGQDDRPTIPPLRRR